MNGLKMKERKIDFLSYPSTSLFLLAFVYILRCGIILEEIEDLRENKKNDKA